MMYLVDFDGVGPDLSGVMQALHFYCLYMNFLRS